MDRHAHLNLFYLHTHTRVYINIAQWLLVRIKQYSIYNNRGETYVNNKYTFCFLSSSMHNVIVSCWLKTALMTESCCVTSEEQSVCVYRYILVGTIFWIIHTHVQSQKGISCPYIQEKNKKNKNEPFSVIFHLTCFREGLS